MIQDNEAVERTRMVELLESLAKREGFSPTRLEGVQVIRTDQPQSRRPVVYSPSIIIVAQGRKASYLGPQVHTYDPDNFLVLSVLTPFECEVVQASPEKPYLALSIGVDVAVLGELVLELGALKADTQPLSVVASSRLTPELRQSAVRLLECLHSREDSRILGRQIVREIIYRVLRGPQGNSLRALTGVHGGFSQIAKVLQIIHSGYSTPLDVETLAREANMSISVFHQHFKAITASSPIQYVKSIRLHKARMLMSQEGFNAKSAAVEVGYASPSQFSREFKRFFGTSPAEEAARMRGVGFSR